MKREIRAGLAFGLAAWLGGSPALEAAPAGIKKVPMLSRAPSPAARRLEDRILVRFRAQASSTRRAAALARLGASERNEIAPIGVKIVSVPPGVTPEAMVRRIQTEMGREVEFAEVDAVWTAQKTPSDPLFGSQYHLGKTACSTAWDTVTGQSVTLAIADTGVSPIHSDLAGHLVPGTNVAEGNSDTTDSSGHGTAVAGAAAAIGDNGVDVAGVAYNASIMPIKIVVGGAGTSDDATIASAITYAADRGVKVLNLSFGSSSCDSQTMLAAASYMRSKGGLVVQSAGNDSLNRGCSATPEVIIVSATDAGDQLASFSNFGQEIAASAPGDAIITTNCDGCSLGSGYGSVAAYSGTSFSSPITAGVLALIFSIDPNFTPDQAQAILFDSADDLGASGFDIQYGWGRVNAAKAVSLARERSTTFQSQTLTNVYAYPNPWDIRQNSQRLVTFANIPEGASVRIFTLSGFWVKTLTPSNGRALWDLTNDAGQPVASGLYFYIAKTGDNNHKARGAVAIIR